MSRIPSIQSKLKQPSVALVKTSTALPHFGIARGVQHVQPQPSMAYGLNPAAPPMRVQRRSNVAGSQLDAVKSRSQVDLYINMFIVEKCFLNFIEHFAVGESFYTATPTEGY